MEPSQNEKQLEQLEGFLREDPDNGTLLAQIFELALRSRQWAKAEFYLRHAQTLQRDAVAWSLREGDFWLAQQHWSQAREVLEQLQSKLHISADVPAQLTQVVTHNLAYIEFRQGAYADCIARLAVYLEVENQAQPTDSALQQLWLRALHRAGELRRACDWTLSKERLGMLENAVAGIASLIALDASDLAAARRWADLSLNNQAPAKPSIEALVTRASLALAERDVPTAKKLADAALQMNQKEGRAWSVRAFADMLAGDFVAATRDFVRALDAMPEHVGTWHGQGWVQVLQKNLDGAQLSFEKALALDHNFSESHGGLAVVLALKGLTQQAQQHIELALRLDKTNLSGRYAQTLLSGEGKDAANLQRLARRLMEGRSGPLGGLMADWLPDSKNEQ